MPTGTFNTTLKTEKVISYPLKKAVGPSLVNMVIAQLGTLGYCPGRELMNLVFTTSAGEARNVVQNPATRADSKWHGTSSERVSKIHHHQTSFTGNDSL